MTPEVASEFLSRLDELGPSMREVLAEHVKTLGAHDMMAVARAWYDRDPDSFEAFIKPLPAPLRAALRDYLHRDYMARFTYK